MCKFPSYITGFLLTGKLCSVYGMDNITWCNEKLDDTEEEDRQAAEALLEVKKQSVKKNLFGQTETATVAAAELTDSDIEIIEVVETWEKEHEILATSEDNYRELVRENIMRPVHVRPLYSMKSTLFEIYQHCATHNLAFNSYDGSNKELFHIVHKNIDKLYGRYVPMSIPTGEYFPFTEWAIREWIQPLTKEPPIIRSQILLSLLWGYDISKHTELTLRVQTGMNIANDDRTLYCASCKRQSKNTKPYRMKETMPIHKLNLFAEPSRYFCEPCGKIVFKILSVGPLVQPTEPCTFLLNDE